MKIRRSILSVPGNLKKMHQKALDSNVDVIMFDLEDSVSIGDKETARKVICESLSELTATSKILSLRINSIDTMFAYRDIIEVVSKCGNKLDSIVIPKVLNSGDIAFVSRLLDQIESEYNLPNRIFLEASIETAEGMNNIREIASCDNRIISLVFGIADYSASLGAKLVSVSGHGENEDSIYPGHRWHNALSTIAMVAKANNLLSIDAPYGNFRDDDGLSNSCTMAAALGIDAKWAIHPNQIDIINKVFSPLPEEIELAKKIIDAAHQSKTGAIQLDGKMIDRATLRLAQKTYDYAIDLGLI